MKISKWHVRQGAGASPLGSVSRRGKGRVANANEPATETHYILIDGETFARIEAIASKRSLSVQELVEYAINRTLDTIYMGRSKDKANAQ